MKNIIKISSLILVLTCFWACEDNYDLGASPVEDIGWIEFPSGNPTSLQINTVAQPTFNVGVNVQVPVVADDFTISYDLVPVSGLDPNVVFSNTGTIVSPAGQSSYAGPDNSTGSDYEYLANIEFDGTAVPQLTELMIFDVVLTASSDPRISVGFNNEKRTVQRVTILCATNPDVIPADFYVGEFAIADSEATIGPGNGTENFGSGTVTLVVDPSNPDARLFDATALPAFTGGAPFATSIVFSTEDESVNLGGYLGLGISCNGVAEYGFTSAPSDATAQWNICQTEFIEVFYTEDPNGSCGGPFEASFTLTKL